MFTTTQKNDRFPPQESFGKHAVKSKPAATEHFIVRPLEGDAKGCGTVPPASSFDYNFGRIAVGRLLRSRSLQAKLQISQPGDIYEQEADRIADEVTAAPTKSIAGVTPPRIQRVNGAATVQTDAAPSSVDQALANPGRPLEPALQQEMGQRFGYDFSGVGVHTDAAAEQSARDVNSHAYTIGHNIVFGAGRFAPETQEGRRLIAHELTHVVQQTGAVQRQPDASPVPGPQEPLFTVWVDDERRRTDKRYAERLGREDAARISQSPKLTLDLRQEINAKLRFFEGKAWEAYGRSVKPALQESLHPLPVLEMDVEFAADERKRADTKFALQVGREDAARVRSLGRISGKFREELNAKMRFFEGRALDVYQQQIKAVIDQIIPGAQELRDFCTSNINDVWGAQNQGLEDFEHQLGSDIDFGAIAWTVLGNVIWAGAAYATGDVAFLISIIGIGVGTAGPLIPHVKDRPSFHTAARKQIDDLMARADGRIDAVVRAVREDALTKGWDGNKAREILLKRLLKPEYINVVAGGVPVIDLPAVAASVEKELLFRAATTPWKDWAGWQKGDAWLGFDYTLDDAEAGLFKPVAPSRWPPAKTTWVWIFPLGNAEIPDLNERLNVLYDEVLHQPMDTKGWPIRKEVEVLIRQAGTVDIVLGKDNSVQGWGATIDDRYIRGWLALAGMEGASKQKFPELLLNHLWKQSGGKPPVIEKLFM